MDPRFNADEILAEVDTATKLSVADRLLYRYVLIPRTKQALLNPSRLLFHPALQHHRQEPRSPFSEQRMKDLQTWLSTQR
jgi:hypothetical protein